MHPMINIALRAARNAGELILRGSDRVDSLKIERKNMNDFVSEIDVAAEKEIVYHLHKAYPEHAILSEECGLIEPLKNPEKKPYEYLWIIDPLDGTNNFLHGIPHYAVSIACIHKNRLTHAVIYDPIRNDEFIASRGEGAMCNGKRIRCSNKMGLDNAMISIGIPSLQRQAPYQHAYLECINTLQQKHQTSFRNSGSAALSLAYVAAGRVDGYFEPGLKQWDVSAGALLVQEAGGFVSDFSGGTSYMSAGNTTAATAKCFKPLLKTVQAHLGKIEQSQQS